MSEEESGTKSSGRVAQIDAGYLIGGMSLSRPKYPRQISQALREKCMESSISGTRQARPSVRRRTGDRRSLAASFLLSSPRFGQHALHI
jgi:hypothetical protein